MTTTRIHRRRTRLLGLGALVAVLGAGVWGFHGRLAGHGADGRHAERMRRHMEHALEHALDRTDASDAQRERIRAIADETREALLALAGDGPGAAREAIAASLLGPEVDRAAVEQLRLEGLERMDEASHIVLGALADAAEVLTPEQRAELAELREERIGAWRGWHR